LGKEKGQVFKKRHDGVLVAEEEKTNDFITEWSDLRERYERYGDLICSYHPRLRDRFKSYMQTCHRMITVLHFTLGELILHDAGQRMGWSTDKTLEERKEIFFIPETTSYTEALTSRSYARVAAPSSTHGHSTSTYGGGSYHSSSSSGATAPWVPTRCNIIMGGGNYQAKCDGKCGLIHSCKYKLCDVNKQTAPPYGHGGNCVSLTAALNGETNTNPGGGNGGGRGVVGRGRGGRGRGGPPRGGSYRGRGRGRGH
jgi:hypothetical protein